MCINVVSVLYKNFFCSTMSLKLKISFYNHSILYYKRGVYV